MYGWKTSQRFANSKLNVYLYINWIDIQVLIMIKKKINSEIAINQE